MYDLNTVDSQLYSDSKIIMLLQKLMELCHFQPPRGKQRKDEKTYVRVLYRSLEPLALVMTPTF